MAGYSSFQSNAFQSNAFQIIGSGSVTPAHNSGGYGHGYLEALNNADRLRRRVKELPDVVEQAIEQAVSIPQPARRKALVESKLAGVEFKFLRLYIDILEKYHQAILDAEAERLARIREEDELLLLLLMST